MVDDGERIGLLFSGQGSQRAGMGERYRHTDSWEIVDALSELTGHDVAELLLTADDATLTRTDRAQVATFALEMVALDDLRRRTGLLDVVAIAGHSLGEYSALAAAGVVDVATAARLVAARGAAMLAAAEANPGTMVAVLGAADDAVEAALATVQAQGAQVWLANLNAPGQVVLAGTADGVAAATEALAATRAKVRALPVGGAFHSPLMAPARDALTRALAAAEFAAEASVPVVANVDARPRSGGDEWRDLLAAQLTAPVRWTESVRALVGELGCTSFVEVGPGDTLCGMVKRIARDVGCRSVSGT